MNQCQPRLTAVAPGSKKLDEKGPRPNTSWTSSIKCVLSGTSGGQLKDRSSEAAMHVSGARTKILSIFSKIENGPWLDGVVYGNSNSRLRARASRWGPLEWGFLTILVAGMILGTQGHRPKMTFRFKTESGITEKNLSSKLNKKMGGSFPGGADFKISECDGHVDLEVSFHAQPALCFHDAGQKYSSSAQAGQAAQICSVVRGMKERLIHLDVSYKIICGDSLINQILEVARQTPLISEHEA